MPAFGGFCQMPIRLGGDGLSDWNAASHARLVADVAAAKRTAALAVMTIDIDAAGGTATVTQFTSRAEFGVGSSYVPTVTLNGTGDVSVEFTKAWTDEFDVSTSISIRNGKAARAAAGGGDAVVNVEAANEVRVRVTNAAGAPVDGAVTVLIYGAIDQDSAYGQRAEIGAYGGSTDKHDVRTEVIPYSWGWYLAIQGGRGSAYSKSRGTLVHAENIALARAEAARTRAAERMTCNAQPLTADERLEYWAQVLAVHRRENEPRWRLRLRCAAKYQTVLGPSPANVDAALQTLLGTAYVKSWRQVGASLAVPPTQTFWPGVNPGPVAYNLGGGTWLSERSNLVVEVQRPAGMTDSDLAYLLNVQMFELLDRTLPAYMTFNWGFGVTSGFVLDVSKLDFNGLAT